MHDAKPVGSSLQAPLEEPLRTLHEMVADKLERADAPTREALLRVPLDNIDRWLASGVLSAPQRAEHWRQIVLRAQESPAGFEELLKLLRDQSEAAERVKDFAPFAGVLNAQERRAARPRCAYHF